MRGRLAAPLPLNMIGSRALPRYAGLRQRWPRREGMPRDAAIC